MDMDKTFRGQWCKDAETGDYVLIDQDTNEILFRGDEQMDTNSEWLPKQEIAYQEGFEAGCNTTYEDIGWELKERDNQIRELESRLESLESKIKGFIGLGVSAFIGEKHES